MSPIITYTLIAAMGLYGVVILVEFVLSRKPKRFAVEALILLAVAVLLNVATGFPATQQAFGGASPLVTIGVMYLCVILGIVARHIFYLKGGFSWVSLLKPLCISPIVLLPLIGTVQGGSGVEPIQMVSFGILGFQNGFFWELVLQHARSTV